MSDNAYVRWFGWAAVGGGGLRAIASFVPYTPNSLPLEAFYLVIDILLLLGLIGIYAARRERLGILGLAGFATALIGQISILGPDWTLFGGSAYQTSILVIALGLVIMSVAMLMSRARPVAAAWLWIASPLLSIAGAALGQAEAGFLAAGLAYAIAFVIAGWATART